MLITALVNYANREKLVEDPLFETGIVRWQISLSDQGTFLGLLDLATEKQRRGAERVVPKKLGGRAGKVATFGVDRASFVLGIADHPDGQEKADGEWSAFRELMSQAAQATAEALFIATSAFLADARQIELARATATERRMKSSDVVGIGFASQSDRPIYESEAGKAFWRGHQAAKAARKPAAASVECLSCGEVAPQSGPADTSLQLTSLGGASSGSALISFDEPSFWSHGWNKNGNAPVCQLCSLAYTRALKHLLNRDNRRRVDLPGRLPRNLWRPGANEPNHRQVAYVCWADSGPNPVELLLAEQSAMALLKAVRAGEPTTHPPGDRLYALAVRGNGGRAVVVDWFDVSLSRGYEAVARWFDDLQVALPLPYRSGEDTRFDVGATSDPPSLTDLCYAVGSDDHALFASLLRAAWLNTPLPLSVATGCLIELRKPWGSDRGHPFWNPLTPARLGLLRCTLNRLARIQETKETPEVGIRLDANNPLSTPGYVFGRAFATLESIQYLADRIGTASAGESYRGLNRSIVDSYFSQASTHPGLIFPRLIQMAMHHLSVIRRHRREGLANSLGRELNDLIAILPPTSDYRILDLTGQMHFMLGYAHQKASRLDATDDTPPPDDDDDPNPDPQN